MRHFRPFLNLDKCRPEATADVISGIFVVPVVRDNLVRFRDPSLNASRQMSPKAVGIGICDCFFPYNFREEVYNDVISSVAPDDNVGLDVCAIW